MVELPKDFTCEDCTIRLLREASEWSNNYRFWSCADVDIVEQKKYKETCMGHGRPIAGRCVCNKGTDKPVIWRELIKVCTFVND